MRHQVVIVICWLAALAALPLLAQTPNTASARTLSMDECVQLALRHNLDIQIRRVQPGIDRLKLDGAYGAYDPSFNFGFSESFDSSPGSPDPNSTLFGVSSKTYTERFGSAAGAPGAGFRGTLPSGMTYDLLGSVVRRSGSSFTTGFRYSADADLTLRQPLLKNSWIDATRRDILLVKKDIKVSELDVLNQIIATVTSVQTAYYDLIYSLENVKVQEKALELAEKLLAENKKRVEVGALAPLDELQAESQVAARRADLLSAQRDLETQENTLKGLLTDEFTAWQGVALRTTGALLALPETFDLQESYRRAMTLRPDLQQSREGVEKQNITIRYNRNQLFPQLDLTATYGHNGLGSTLDGGFNGIQQGNNPGYSIGVVLSIPLNNTTAKGNYSFSKATKEKLLLQLKQQEQKIMVEIDNSVKTARSNYQKTDATRQARRYAEAALDAEQKKLENGKSTSFVVLQLQRDLTSARSAEIRALADYNKSLAVLAQSEGFTLEKNKIAVEVAK
ncbi:MAG: TolC family protein [Verrucomicrobia bacterium]|nr:TolC family protein [Verrucomicrobiota bacterium]